MVAEPIVTALLVEDDQRLARLTADYLEGHAVRVTLARDGEQGLAEAGRQRFDVVLLDLMLPRLGGLEVCQKLRARSDVPILILTARDATADKVQNFEAGADDYLTKPFAFPVLTAKINAVLRRYGAAAANGKIKEQGLELDPGARTAHDLFPH